MKKNISQLSYKDIGLQDRRIKITPEIVNQMKQLRNQGLSYEKIARKLDINYANVYLHLNPDYYKKYKERMTFHSKKYYAKNRDKLLKRHRIYENKRKEALKSMDLSKFIEPKNKIKDKILNLLKSEQEYTYRQIKDYLQKDYCIFSNRIKELKEENLIEIIQYENHKCIKLKK